MTEILKILQPISDQTGLGIDVYTLSGDILLSTGENFNDYTFTYHKPEDFQDGVILDFKSNITYFLTRRGNSFVGVVMGANDVSRNYAIMVSKIIETSSIPKDITSFVEKLRLLLCGELPSSHYNAVKAKFNEKDFNYYVLTLVTANNKMKELKNFLSTVAAGEDFYVEMDEHTVAYIKKCGQDDEYQSAHDFASILYDNIKEELRIELVISVGGTVKSVDDFSQAYSQSQQALSYGKMLDPSCSIYSFKQYFMIKLLSDLKKDTLEGHLKAFMDKGWQEIFADEELITTADNFLKNSLNISETSRVMFMHRNTLIYRLDKIEKATGLNIRHFNDAMVFRLATILFKIVKKKEK